MTATPPAERDLAALATTGGALAAISLVSIVVPASLIEYAVLRASAPLTLLYPGGGAHYLFLVSLILLVAVFLGALRIGARLSGRRAVLVVLGGTAVLALLYVLAFPSGSVDVYHNIADTRTLWVYGDNPLRVPPSAHSDQPIAEVVYAWRSSTSRYGPLAYVIYGPAVLIAGEGVVASLIAVKAVQAMLLVLLTWLVGWAAADLRPDRRIQAMLLVGWNPFVLYEGVGNAHNDLVMALLAVVGLAITGRRLLAGPGLVVVSAAVKYMSGLLTPLTALWIWRNGSPGQRRRLAVAAALAALALVVIAVVAREEIESQRRFAAPAGSGFFSPIAVLAERLEPIAGDDSATVARYLAWSLFGAVGLAAMLRLGRSAGSLWVTAFWLMAAAAVLIPTRFWAWYMLWFVPLGAVLASSREADFAVAASAAGLLSYGVFPWWQFGEAASEVYVALVWLAPLAYVLLVDHLALPTTRERTSRSGLGETGLPGPAPG